MTEPVYTVERCCGREVVDTMTLIGDSLGTPRQVLESTMFVFSRTVPLNPDEDWFRVIDPAGATWFWHFRDGTIQRLLRPPVSPGSLPPSP